MKRINTDMLNDILFLFCSVSLKFMLVLPAHYEEFCLKRINYNIFAYSSYDWITQFISNGIIFNNEINENNEIINIQVLPLLFIPIPWTMVFIVHLMF